MAAVDQKGSFVAPTMPLDTLLHYCRTLLRSEEQALRHAMLEYEQYLHEQRQPATKAA